MELIADCDEENCNFTFVSVYPWASFTRAWLWINAKWDASNGTSVNHRKLSSLVTKWIIINLSLITLTTWILAKSFFHGHECLESCKRWCKEDKRSNFCGYGVQWPVTKCCNIHHSIHPSTQVFWCQDAYMNVCTSIPVRHFEKFDHPRPVCRHQPVCNIFMEKLTDRKFP